MMNCGENAKSKNPIEPNPTDKRSVARAPRALSINLLKNIPKNIEIIKNNK